MLSEDYRALNKCGGKQEGTNQEEVDWCESRWDQLEAVAVEQTTVSGRVGRADVLSGCSCAAVVAYTALEAAEAVLGVLANAAAGDAWSWWGKKPGFQCQIRGRTPTNGACLGDAVDGGVAGGAAHVPATAGHAAVGVRERVDDLAALCSNTFFLGGYSQQNGESSERSHAQQTYHDSKGRADQHDQQQEQRFERGHV